jgi:hypothetical protein
MNHGERSAAVCTIVKVYQNYRKQFNILHLYNVEQNHKDNRKVINVK